MHWQVLGSLTQSDQTKRLEEFTQILLTNRGLISHQDQENFFRLVKPNELKLKQVGLSHDRVTKAAKYILKNVLAGKKIVIYGDYDADGICATGILWETLHALGGQAIPFIPHREHHGYGLSQKGVQDVLALKPDLVITVDNGIVAHEAAQELLTNEVELVITDHHQPGSSVPPHTHLVHSTTICGSGVAWILAREIAKLSGKKELVESCLDLLAIGTIADLMPMTDVNRSFAKFGLEALTKTNRPGLVALKKEAGIAEGVTMSTYHVGYVLGPRINAMGRIEHGLDALRLLCTKDMTRATDLATTLGQTNRTRQDLTMESVELAEKLYLNSSGERAKVIVIDHPEFHEGIIGLIAGKLTEKYYKPSIVIATGESVSKASARSVTGVNIIELIRTKQELLINAGGHPGAAGFTISTDMIGQFRTELTGAADGIADELLTPSLTIDCRVEPRDLTQELYNLTQRFAPFGVGNSQPLLTTTLTLCNVRPVGQEGKHLKLELSDKKESIKISGIGFGLGEKAEHLNTGDSIDLAFSLDLNHWNGQTNLQLVVKDVATKSG